MFREMLFRASMAVLLLTRAAYPQQATELQDVPSPSVGISEWVSIVRIPAIPNAPFSATTMMDNTHTLADGTAVTTKTMTTIARDSKGRTHNENRYYLRPSDQGEGRIRDITIFDPESRMRTTLKPDAMQATIVTLAPRSTPPATTTSRPQLEREDLGQSSIDGEPVHGFRQSRTIPAGEDGNDRPITIVDEYWYSDELHMNITLKHTDPRHGEQSVRLTELKRDEPDPRMFEIPANYPRPSENSSQGAVRIGAAMAAANLIERVEPRYPPMAAAAGIQGSVEFNVLIGEDGLVRNVQLIRGHPLLVNAAKEAVLAWRYRPTLLNGNPVSVTSSVILNFTVKRFP